MSASGEPPNSLRAVMTLVSEVPARTEHYERTLRGSFERRYREERDSWTADSAAIAAGRELLARLPEGRACSLLDIGAGRGRDLDLFLRAGHRATGIDIIAPDNWPAMREKWGDSLTLVHASLLELRGHLSERFDAILDNGCFHHQPPEQIPAYLGLVRDLLAPSGIALFAARSPLPGEA